MILKCQLISTTWFKREHKQQQNEEHNRKSESIITYRERGWLEASTMTAIGGGTGRLRTGLMRGRIGTGSAVRRLHVDAESRHACRLRCAATSRVASSVLVGEASRSLAEHGAAFAALLAVLRGQEHVQHGHHHRVGVLAREPLFGWYGRCLCGCVRVEVFLEEFGFARHRHCYHFAEAGIVQLVEPLFNVIISSL